MKLDIKKNTDGCYKTDTYSGEAKRKDGYEFRFDIYESNGLWHVEYRILLDSVIQLFDTPTFTTMLEAFIFSCDLYKSWMPF